MKRIIAFFAATVLLLSGLVFAVNAAGSSMDTATSISLDSSYSDSITESNYSNYYKITLPSSGEITISFSGDLEKISFWIYAADGTEIDRNYISQNSNSDTLSLKGTYDLTSGSYYIAFKEYDDCTGNYSFSVNYSSAQESFAETQSSKNNSFERSSEITFGTSYNGQIAENDGSDYYKITLPSSGKITVSFSGDLEKISFWIYAADGTEIDRNYISQNSNSDTLSLKETYDLTSGFYYMAFKEYDDYTGNYSFNVSKGTTPPPTQAPTQAPVNDTPDNDYPVDNTPDDGGDEPVVTAPPADYIEPDDPDYIIPDTDSDIEIEINIYLNFEYTVVNNYVVITNYIGDETYVTVPGEIDGYEVVGIGENAFSGTGVETVEIPAGVTQFGSNAFGEDSGDYVQIVCDEGSAAQSYAEKKNISYSTFGHSVDDYSDPGFDIRIVIIILVVVAAVAGVVAVILISKKKTKV